MDTADLTIPDIYDMLAEGAVVKLQLPDKEAVTNFRSRLATYKHRSEAQLLAIGAIEPMTLSISYDAETCIAEVKLTQKANRSTVTFKLILD